MWPQYGKVYYWPNHFLILKTLIHDCDDKKKAQRLLVSPADIVTDLMGSILECTSSLVIYVLDWPADHETLGKHS